MKRNTYQTLLVHHALNYFEDNIKIDIKSIVLQLVELIHMVQKRV